MDGVTGSAWDVRNAAKLQPKISPPKSTVLIFFVSIHCPMPSDRQKGEQNLNITPFKESLAFKYNSIGGAKNGKD